MKNMGDPRRFLKFSLFVSDHFPDRNLRIADVAGGKGYLQSELRRLGYKDVVSFDRRRRNANPNRQKFYRYEFFDGNNHQGEFDLVLGMHPDDGTDHIIDYSNKNNVPFAVCPCCIRPSAIPYDRNVPWIDHLLNFANGAKSAKIEITGKNIVLFKT